MKTGFSEEDQVGIRRAKEILRRLVRQAGMNQQELLAQLEQQGLSIQQSTFSTWLSPRTLNVRPKPEVLRPLVTLCCRQRTAAQRQEVLDELNRLLGFERGPLTSEQIHNRVSKLLEDPPESLSEQQDLLRDQLESLDALLDLIEPRVMDYGCYNPVIFVEAGERKLVKQLLGTHKDSYREYEVESGFEIPLTKIQSLEAMVSIIDDLNEGVRLLQRYLDRHLNDSRGLGPLDAYRVDDYITYAWEISDRLLHYNLVIKAVPALKRALLRQMTVCCGVRYVLGNLTRESSEIAFQNVLALKTRDFDMDIHCSVAVFVGMLARQQMRTGLPECIKRSLRLYRRAVDWLEAHHEQLGTEQEIFHYKKELANLHYDLANFSLPHQQRVPDFERFISTAMSQAVRFYAEVLETENLFVQGLSSVRLGHLRLFYTISRCWGETAYKGEKALLALEPPTQLDESYWTVQIARAIGFGVLARRWPQNSAGYQQQALAALERARLVDGFAERTEQEIAAEYILCELVQAMGGRREAERPLAERDARRYAV